MTLRIVLFIVVGFAFFAIFSNFISPAGMNTTIQNLQASVVTMAYAGEFNEIRLLLNDFIKLREIRNSADANEFAEKLDDRVNNLELVKMYCQKKISTLDLVFEKEPYQKLQQICPQLKNVSFSKAVQLFRLI